MNSYPQNHAGIKGNCPSPALKKPPQNGASSTCFASHQYTRAQDCRGPSLDDEITDGLDAKKLAELKMEAGMNRIFKVPDTSTPVTFDNRHYT
jgi:hypothetical protein